MQRQPSENGAVQAIAFAHELSYNYIKKAYRIDPVRLGRKRRAENTAGVVL